MSKVIRDSELAAMVHYVVHGRVLSVKDDYLGFLEDIGKVVAKYCGGEVVAASADDMDDGLGHCVHFAWTERVPEDGGIYRNFDTDVPVDEWREQSLSDQRQLQLIAK